MGQSAIVIGPFPPLRGGISQHTARLSDALEDAGVAVTRISWSSQYPKRLYGRQQRDVGAPTPAGILWMLKWWDPVSWLRAGLRIRQADFVVVPWVTPVHAIPQWVMLTIGRRSRRVVHVHNVFPHERMPFARPLARLVLRRADALVCHARSLVGELRELGVSAPIAVTPMPPLINVPTGALPADPTVKLLFLGMIRPYKGLDIALRAVEELQAIGHRVELTVAGELWSGRGVPTREELEQLAPSVSLKLQYLSDDEMVDLIAAHHLLLAPYRSATQSGVVSLALAAGRPVVATRVGGLGEIVVEGHNGTLAEPDDVRSFVAAAERALASLETLSAGAAQTPLSWNDYARVVLDDGGSPAR